jgi:hypothetical protein
VVILLPAVLLVVVIFTFSSGSMGLMVLLPMLLVVAAGGAFVNFVLQEGRARRDMSVRQIPTDHLRRQMYMALRPQRRAIRQQQQQEKEPEGDEPTP